MKYLGKLIFRGISILALILWLGLLALWVRSQGHGDSYLHVGPAWSWLVLSANGGMCFTIEKHEQLMGTPLPETVGFDSARTTNRPLPSTFVRSLSFHASFGGGYVLPTSSSSSSTRPADPVEAMKPLTLTQTMKPGAGAGSSEGWTSSDTFTLTFTPKSLPPRLPESSEPILAGAANPRPTLMDPARNLRGMINMPLSMGFVPWMPNPPATPARFYAYRSRTTLGVVAESRVLILPHWALLLLGAIPIGMLQWIDYLRRRGQRRAKAGLCVRCGYDLRATPQCCPECGTAVPALASSLSAHPPLGEPSSR